MKVAIISDIHDHIENLQKALTKIKDSGCEAIICCGDICAPFSAKILTEANLPTSAVFGNNDGDQAGLVLMTEGKIKFTTVGQEHAELELGGKKIAFVHYPHYARLLAESNKYDAVFYGHDHLKNLETIGQTTLCNPGPVCGIIKGEMGVATFAIYDTDSNQIEFITLMDPETSSG